MINIYQNLGEMKIVHIPVRSTRWCSRFYWSENFDTAPPIQAEATFLRSRAAAVHYFQTAVLPHGKYIW